eukprot:4451767-Alexandrium_andersonii.AAC.1
MSRMIPSFPTAPRNMPRMPNSFSECVRHSQRPLAAFQERWNNYQTAAITSRMTSSFLTAPCIVF